MSKGANNLNFLINLLDKDFFACYKLKSFNAKEVGDLHIMYFLMNKSLKQKKEVGMKKLVIVALAVFLAMPVLSQAGSATSRWDLTIGGYIATILQYSDQADAAPWGATYAPARRTGNTENYNNEFSNTSANVDVRVGMRIAGPDTFGAKSSAYLEWDFTGGWGGENGEAKIRHAWMKFDWAKDAILFGNATVLYRDIAMGLPPGTGQVIAEPVLWGGPRNVQLRWEHKWTKEFMSKFALVWAGQDRFYQSGTINEFTMSNLPQLAGQIRYASDACGKVGPLNLAFAMNGVIGKSYFARTDTAAVPGAVAGRPYSGTHGYGWLANAAFQIPIIPERNNNKAMGLVFRTNVEVTQGLGIGLSPVYYLSSASPGYAYRSGSDYSKARAYLLETTLNFWFTDTIYSQFTYALNRFQYSSRYMLADSNRIDRKQYWLAGVFYQPNPSLVTGIEYTRYRADYSLTGTPATKKYGTANAVRFGAYYYF
jgi:hypothetical protein